MTDNHADSRPKGSGFLNLDAGTLRGALFTFASAACISVTFIAVKQATLELSPLAFSPIWFAVATVWGAGLYLFQSGLKIPRNLRASTHPLLALGFFNGTANLLLFTAINLGDPTLVAFFSRSETVYTVLMGWWLLGEQHGGEAEGEEEVFHGMVVGMVFTSPPA